MNKLSKSESLPWLTFALSVGAVAPLLNLTSAVVMAAPNAKLSFPDIKNHWARPFIEPLAEKNILAGYPDGTFRPSQPMDRDEFAAVVRKAFDKKPIREIASGSTYKDVPTGYWAAPAIEEAYEAGFMSGFPGQTFRPQQNISRVEALVSLEKNLNLSKNPTVAVNKTSTVPLKTNQATTQPVRAKKATRRPVFMPMAMTSLMQPLVVPVARASNAQAVGNNNQAVASQNSARSANKKTTSLTTPASISLSNYYVDANKIPNYAVNNVKSATKANLVVNHPNIKVLNPNQPATRADVASFIYQALVAQGRIKELPNNVKASNYIVANPNSKQSKPAK